MTLLLDRVSRKINNRNIIYNLTLKVSNGECLAILGPSGCGKSTTLRMIAGLDSVSSGRIYINERDITNVSPVNRRVGLVFQSYALFPHLTVAANLTLGLKIRGLTEQDQHIKVSSILAIMRLEELSNRFPSQLSGGQKQRVALARALLRDPDIYLLDEPMSNLDAQLREELRPELRKLILGGEKPVIYVTHDQHEAMSMANRIALLNKGKLEQVGSPKELYNKPSSLFVASFVGRPQINVLNNKENYITAIRPESLRISDNGIQSKFKYSEWLGMHKLIYLETERGTLKMLCKANQNIPDSIKITWDLKDEHHFDLKTHKRIDNI